MVDLEHTVDFDLRVEVDLLLEDLPRSELLCDPRVDFDLCKEVGLIVSLIDIQCLYSLLCDLKLDFDLFVGLELLLEVLLVLPSSVSAGCTFSVPKHFGFRTCLGGS